MIGKAGWRRANNSRPSVSPATGKATGPRPSCGVPYRAGRPVAAHDCRRRGPVGLAFPPDERTLYDVESRATPGRIMWRHDVGADGRTPSNKTRLFDAAGHEA